MKPILFSLLLCSSALAQDRPTFGYGGQPGYLDRKVDGHTYNGRVMYNEGRMPALATNNKLKLTLITNDNYTTPKTWDATIVNWFNTDPRLTKYRQETEFNWYTGSNPHYYQRLRPLVGDGLPVVLLQKPDGSRMMMASVASLPSRGGDLADMLDDAVEENTDRAPVATGLINTTNVVKDHTDYGSQTCPHGKRVNDCPDCNPKIPPVPPASVPVVAPLPDKLPSKKPVLPASLGELALGSVLALLSGVGLYATRR